MRPKYLITLLFSIGFQFVLNANPYNWEEDRKPFMLSDAESTLPELKLKLHQQLDYKIEDNLFVMYSTVHSIIWVNSAEAIGRNNRIYISMNGALELVSLKARTITKEGKVLNFDQSNLKEIKDDEDGNSYKIFAIEGIELGSEIEYFYTRKVGGRIYERFFYQFEVPLKSGTLEVSVPKHLKFDFKSYKGLPNVNTRIADEEIVYTLEANNIPALKKEEFSYYNTNRQRVEMKLAYNTARSQARLYTWDEAAKNFYKTLSELEGSEEKQLNKFVSSLNDNKKDTQAKRVKNIEDKIKTSIQIAEGSNDPNLESINGIIKYKVASARGITKLMFLTYQKLDIKVFPVISCSRDKIAFDGTFDTWGFLDEYFLYFPEIDSYLSPRHFETRMPIIPVDYTAQKALMLEVLQVGNIKSALATIQEIAPLDYKLNTDNLDIQVDFNEDLSENTILQSRIFGGINGTYFSPYYAIMTQEQKQKMVESLIKQTSADANILSWDAKVIEQNGLDDFLIEAKFSTTQFIELAGNKVLFKAGELIGRQSELYQDEVRTSDIENEYNRGYERKITIKIPDGYVVKNPENLKFNVVYQDGSEQPFLFHSDYTLNNNQLTITIEEYYKEIKAPVSRYEDFRKVINAAADFNKVTLVLEKQ